MLNNTKNNLELQLNVRIIAATTQKSIKSK